MKTGGWVRNIGKGVRREEVGLRRKRRRGMMWRGIAPPLWRMLAGGKTAALLSGGRGGDLRAGRRKKPRLSHGTLSGILVALYFPKFLQNSLTQSFEQYSCMINWKNMWYFNIQDMSSLECIAVIIKAWQTKTSLKMFFTLAYKNLIQKIMKINL